MIIVVICTLHVWLTRCCVYLSLGSHLKPLISPNKTSPADSVKRRVCYFQDLRHTDWSGSKYKHWLEAQNNPTGYQKPGIICPDAPSSSRVSLSVHLYSWNLNYFYTNHTMAVFEMAYYHTAYQFPVWILCIVCTFSVCMENPDYLPGSAKHNPTQLNTSVQNATLHCVLCRGYCVSDFSETWHVTVLNLDVLYRARSGLLRDTPCPWSLKMDDIDLVIKRNTLMEIL